MKNLILLICSFTLFAPAAPLQAQRKKSVEKLPARVAELDKNGDGKISAEELPPGARKKILPEFDLNNDNALDALEMRAYLLSKKGEKPSPANVDTNGEVTTRKDIEYASGVGYEKGLGKLDLYLPARKKKFPVLLFIHGGGLHSGDKSRLEQVGRRFALHGIAVVAPNYRLSPAVKYPAHIEDVARAFRWTWDQISSHGGDRKKIFVAGGSSGGHLTMLLTLDESYLSKVRLKGSSIRGAIPISGLMDVTRTGPLRRGKVWEDSAEVMKKASPLSWVRKDAPPILILFADGETPERARQNRQVYEALRKTGHPDVKLQVLADRTHNSIRPNLSNKGDPALLAILAFLKTHSTLKPTKP
ncbi:MAG: alpha/beta hydrolase fold domain-containing protein [Planctomycetota bacterium]